MSDKCPHCGGDASDNWFDRSICPDPCGSMHTRCANCGGILGRECAWERRQARNVTFTPDELASHDAQVRAEAWDEGHAAAGENIARQWWGDGEPIPNPYRAAEQ